MDAYITYRPFRWMPFDSSKRVLEMSTGNDKAPAALIEWFEKNGGYWSSKVQISSDDKLGFKILAKSPIIKLDKIVQCPTSLAITSDKAKAYYGDDYARLQDSNAALKAFLCHQKLKGSVGFWWPYIEMLPTTFATPYFYSDEEMEGLKGTNIYEEKSSVLDRWKVELSQVQKYFPDITWELYLWACNVFSSRSFPSRLLQEGGMQRGDEQDHPVLLPVVDLLNHHPKTPILWDDTEDGVSIKVMSPQLNIGDEIFNNYGPKGNEELIMGYGFSIQNNPFDTVCLKYPGKFYFLSRDNSLPENLLDDVKELIGAKRDDTGLLVSLKALLTLVRALKAKMFRIQAAMLNALDHSRHQQDIERYRNSQHDIIQKAVKECLLLILDKLEAAHSLTTDSSVEEIEREARNSLRFVCLHVESIFSSDLDFAEAMYACFGAEDSKELIDIGVEDELLVLYLGHQLVNNQKSKLAEWMLKMQVKYPSSGEVPESAVSLFESLIPACRQVAPKIFGHEGWNQQLIAWAMTVVEMESFANCLDCDETFILTR